MIQIKNRIKYCSKILLSISITIFILLSQLIITGCTNTTRKNSQPSVTQNHEDYKAWAKEYAPDILKTLVRAPSCGELTCFPTVPTEKNSYPGIPSSLVVLNFCTGESMKAPNLIPPVSSRLAMDEYRTYYKSGNSIVAVELSSGNVVWKHDFSIEWPTGGWEPPVLYKDWVIYSTMVGWRKGTSGCVVAMDNQTGETAWRYQTDEPINARFHIKNDTLYFFQVKFDSSIDDYSSKMVALNLQTQELKCEITVPGSVEKNFYYTTQNGVIVETFIEKFTAGNVYMLNSQTCEYKTIMRPSQEIMGSLLEYADDSVYIYRDEEMSALDISSGELLWSYNKPQEVTGEKPLICKIDHSLLGFFYDQHIVTVKQDTGEILKTVQINDYNQESVATSEKILSALQGVYSTLNEEEVAYYLNHLQVQPSPEKLIKELEYDVLPVQWKHEIKFDKEKEPYKIFSGINTVYDSKIYIIENDSTIKVIDLSSGDLLKSETVPSVIHSKLVVDDTAIYYKNEDKDICALYRTTLKPKWTHTLSEDEWTGHLWEDMKLFGNKLFAVTYTRDSKYKQEENLGSVYGNLIVLNKNTGEEEWKYILPENAGVIDSDLFIWNNLLFFTHYDGESSIHNSSRTGSYGGTVYKVDMNTYAVTSILCPGMIFNGSLLNTQSSLYAGHHGGSIFQIDPLKEKVTKVFNSYVVKGNKWKLLQYVDDAILIMGPGPLQCYELPTLQPKWTCVLPNQLHIVSNVIEWDENNIIVADEASNFHLINKHTGVIEQSFSIPMSLLTGHVGFTPWLTPSKQTLTVYNNLLLIKTKNNEQIIMTALDISKELEDTTIAESKTEELQKSEEKQLFFSVVLDAKHEVQLSSYADIDVTDYCTGHDDENIYVLTNQGVLLKHSVDAQKNLLIYNQEFKKTYQSFDYDSFVNFGQSIVLDGYIDRRNIQSTFLSKKTAEPIGSAVIYSFNRPYYITDQYLYRVGGTVNGGEFGLTIQDSSGKEAWTYPGSEKYGSFYPLYDPYEENGIFNVISVDFSGDSFLKHIAIESKSGKVLLEENIASYDENGWWETLSLYDSKRVLWEDHSVFIESYDASGIYVMKMILQDDYSLKQQWKQYFSTEPLEEANYLTGIYNIHTSSYSGIVVPVNNFSTAYQSGSYVLFLDKENGKPLWKIEDKSVYSPDQVFPTSSYLLLKEDYVERSLVDLETEESDLLTALNYEDGSVAWQTTIPRSSNNNDQFGENTIDIADTSAYYSFDKLSKTISRVDALTGTLSDTVLLLQDTILFADFYQVKQSVYLALSTITKDHVNNVLILRIE